MHVLGTAGHVDHGKSSLVQRLTGTHPDRLIEERTREMTIDLGFAWMPLEPGREVAIVDVPGHARFIDNMLAGSGGINACLLVVAADDGWMPQTQEHLDILQFLGVEHGVVALTKIDLVDDETVELATEEIQENLCGTSLANARIVPVSAASGTGISTLADAIKDLLATAPPAADHGRPKLWVDRVFSIAGSGTVVTGTLTGGAVSVGDLLALLPQADRARIRGVQTHGRSVDRIGPGHRVALNLAGLKHRQIHRGDVLVREDQWELTRTAGVLLQAPDHLDLEVTDRGAYHVHVGSARLTARLRIDGDALEPGGQALARIDLERPIPLTFGDTFILRDVGRRRIAAGGRVLAPMLDCVPGRNWQCVMQALDSRRQLDISGLTRVLVHERTITSETGLIPELGLDECGLSNILDGLESKGEILRRNGLIISSPAWQEASLAIQHEVKAFLAANPREIGLARASLADASGIDQPLFDLVLVELAQNGALVANGPYLALPDHRIELSAEEGTQLARLDELLQAAGTRPPLVDELVADGWPEDLLKTFVRLGHLEQIDPTIIMAPSTIDEIVARLVTLTRRHGPFTVADARDALQSSRKFVMPILYYLDQRGITRRDKDHRIVRNAARIAPDELSA